MGLCSFGCHSGTSSLLWYSDLYTFVHMEVVVLVC